MLVVERFGDMLLVMFNELLSVFSESLMLGELLMIGKSLAQRFDPLDE